MSDYEKVINYLRQEAEKITSEWNGDEAGELEERATDAQELLDLLESVDTLVKGLDI